MPADRQTGNTGPIGLRNGTWFWENTGEVPPRESLGLQNSRQVFLGTIRKGNRIHMGILVMIPEDRGFLGGISYPRHVIETCKRRHKECMFLGGCKERKAEKNQLFWVL